MPIEGSGVIPAATITSGLAGPTPKLDSFVDATAPVQAALPGVAPGATATLTAVLYDTTGATVTLPEGLVPTWTSSDETNAPLVVAETGLSVTVTVPGSDKSAGVVTISVSVEMPNGTKATGTALLPILVPMTYTFIISQS